MPTWPTILFWPWPPYNILPRSCLTWIFFVYPHWWVPLCVQCPAKAMPFQQIIMHALQWQHDIDVHLLFCFDLDLHITSSRGRVLLGRSFVDPHWWVPLCVQCPAKVKAFKQIIMHALQCQHDVDVHLFCLTLTSIDLLFPSSCITWIFFVDSHWWVPLCVQHPTIYMPFRQIIMYILQCPHDIHVHLFCFDLHKFLLRSRAVTCPTSNCGRGTSLFRQELVYTKRKYINSWTHFVDFLLWPKSATLFHSFL